MVSLEVANISGRYFLRSTDKIESLKRLKGDGQAMDQEI
jgi:hypothetical protein